MRASPRQPALLAALCVLALVSTRARAERIWAEAGKSRVARHRIYDVRLALTLMHHGVTAFATANTKHFRGLGFEELFNPL